MFDWLERHVSGCVDGPPMGSLTIIVPDMSTNRCHNENREIHTMDKTKFLSAVRSVSAAAVPDLTLVIGAPLALSSLADAMQSFVTGGRLCLDLSNWYMHDLIALYDGRPLWAMLVRLSGLRLILDGTGASDEVVLGMVCAVEASLLTDQPVAWRDVNLGLARNLITDNGLTAMIRSLGRCPQLVQLTLDLTENDKIRHPEKLDMLACVIGHIPVLHIKFDARFCHIPLKSTRDDPIPMPNVRTFSLSVTCHQIFPHALLPCIPHRLVHLCLNVSQTKLLCVDGDERAGFGHLGQALMATADTLQILTLGMAHMEFTDSMFVYFCSVGLLPLIHLHRLALDVACNQLTDVGVDSLQHVLSPTIRELKWNLGCNTAVQRVCLEAAQGLRNVMLEVCGTRVKHLQLPAQVLCVTLDLRRTMHTDGSGIHPNQMSVSGVDCVQRLKLRLSLVHSKTVSLLKCIPDWPGIMKMDLHLDLFSMSINAMQSALECIATCGQANTLGTLWLCESSRHHGEFPVEIDHRLPSVLSVCRGLVSLQLELPSAIGLCEILTSVGRDLVNLVYFHLYVRESSATLEYQTVAPCMLLVHHRVLRVVFMDFPGTDLTDEAVALLMDVAVQRCVNNPRNVNTLKVEGSSVGVHAWTALAASTALPGCKFHFYNSFWQKPVSPLLSVHQTVYHPFVSVTYTPCGFD